MRGQRAQTEVDAKQIMTLRPAEELQEAVTEFSGFISALPAASLKAKTWGPREALAHLVFWIESYVAQVDALLSGQSPAPPDGRFDQLNRQMVQASHGVSVKELLDRHRAACDWLCEVAGTVDADDITFVLKQGSERRRSLNWYLAAEADHIRHHQQQLAEQMRWDGSRAALTLQEAVDDLCHFIARLPDTMIAAQEWGPKEILAHLLFWHERHLAQVEAAAGNSRIELEWATVEKLNTAAIANSRTIPVMVLLQRFQEVNGRLCGLAAKLDPQDVILNMKLPYAFHTLDDVLPRIERHVREHLKQLEQIYGSTEEADGR